MEAVNRVSFIFSFVIYIGFSIKTLFQSCSKGKEISKDFRDEHILQTSSSQQDNKKGNPVCLQMIPSKLAVSAKDIQMQPH